MPPPLRAGSFRTCPDLPDKPQLPLQKKQGELCSNGLCVYLTREQASMLSRARGSADSKPTAALDSQTRNCASICKHPAALRPAARTSQDPVRDEFHTGLSLTASACGWPLSGCHAGALMPPEPSQGQQAIPTEGTRAITKSTGNPHGGHQRWKGTGNVTHPTRSGTTSLRASTQQVPGSTAPFWKFLSCDPQLPIPTPDL